MINWLTRRRRARAVARPFPAAWRDLLQRRLWLYPRLNEAERGRLADHVKVFIAEKDFEGCAGLEVTDEMRVLIAAQASLLILHRHSDFFPRCTSILVYPQRYRRTVTSHGPAGVVTETDATVGGESWHGLFSPLSGGPVVLNWPDVEAGATGASAPKNLVLHEFAHQLDSEATGMDGAPALDSAQAYREWARVMGAEYRRLVSSLHQNHPTLLDAYGATSPVEFFAVATEHYFAEPERMRAVHPDLFENLDRFYRPRREPERR